MTYFAFLLCFVVPPILLLLVLTWWDNRRDHPALGIDGKYVLLGIAVHIGLALVYTTPWDNYLVATGVWTYNPALVTGIVFGYVPIEEYTFFIVETILGGLWWWVLAKRIDFPLLQREETGVRSEFKPNKRLVYLSTGLLFACWLFFAYQFFFGPDSWNYLSIIFFWALPAMLSQLLFGADILWHYRKLVFLVIFPLGTYLSLVDIIALNGTTWQISKAQTLGINFFGILPLEEVVFFFITNALICFGLTLMLSRPGRQRFKNWKAHGFKGLPQ